MFEDLLELALSPLGIFVVALFPGGRRLLRRVAKEIIRTSFIVSDELKTIVKEVKEEIESKTEQAEWTEKAQVEVAKTEMMESFEPSGFEKDVNETTLADLTMCVA